MCTTPVLFDLTYWYNLTHCKSFLFPPKFVHFMLCVSVCLEDDFGEAWLLPRYSVDPHQMNTPGRSHSEQFIQCGPRGPVALVRAIAVNVSEGRTTQQEILFHL